MIRRHQGLLNMANFLLDTGLVFASYLLAVWLRQGVLTDAVLRCDGSISDYTYKTDISRDTYNAVQLYHAGRKETERKAYRTEQAEQVKKWGRLQFVQLRLS